MKRLLLTLAMLLGTTVGWAAPAALPALLPRQFAGWQMRGQARVSSDPADADPAYAGVLKEYGFHDLATTTYTQGGRTLAVKAARFDDATGAYGAFTFYKRPGMQAEKIGDLAASAEPRVLFLRGNVLVEAKFDHVTAMSAAELRELAAALPQPAQSASKLPTLPQYLPQHLGSGDGSTVTIGAGRAPAYIPHSAKYVEGPAGLAAINASVPANLVDFTRGAELVQGKYATAGGEATLTLIAYPTPQIAGERLREMQASGGQMPAKRTGPILTVVSGDVSAEEAKALLAAVNYEADVTWNEQTSVAKRDNIGNLVIAALMLSGILMLIALVIGIAFGGVRVLLQRLLPGRVFARDEDVGIIRLNLPR